MGGGSSPLLRPVLVGVNHRSSPLALRDQLFVEDPALPTFLAVLRESGVSQALALSTCDRIEVVACAADIDAAAGLISGVLAQRAGIGPGELARHAYTLTDAAAVRHVFAVAASLDSQVIGEPHVLGQIKACHRVARDAGATGHEMEALLAAAYAAAKRVRGETKLGEGPVSLAAAAVQATRDLHGDLAQCEGLLLGTGEMGELVAESLLAAGLRRLVVAAPRPERAATLAHAFGAETGDFAERAALMERADVLVTALGGRQPLLAAEHLRQALRRRRQKPIFVIDAAVPGDVDAAVNRVDGAYLYDLDDLERLAMQGRAAREAAARDAWAVIDEELAAFMHGHAGRQAVPAVVALRRRFEAERERALAEAGGDAEKATRLLVGRLLHSPSEVLRDLAADDTGAGDWNDAEALLKRLFRLE